MQRKTKIVCTMGPACDSVELLKEMIRAGMTVARLNMAHGDLDEHRARVERVRQAERETGLPVAVMLDVKGPEIRLGKLAEASYPLREGDAVTLTTEPILGTAERLPVSYAELPQDVRIGTSILIDDGLLELKVEAVEGTEVRCRVMNGGVVKPRKSVNLPGVRTSLPGVTERDVEHLLFGMEQGIDFVAMSFVRCGADVDKVRRLLRDNGAEHVGIIAKIENHEGVARLEEILLASDGIMVARGDLGVEIPVEAVPLVQKRMIRACNRAGKPVIVATHMLESMQVNPRPTRAEASDVANAVLDGADAVMLSGETAAGKYPLASVTTMASIAERAESLLIGGGSPRSVDAVDFAGGASAGWPASSGIDESDKRIATIRLGREEAFDSPERQEEATAESVGRRETAVGLAVEWTGAAGNEQAASAPRPEESHPEAADDGFKLSEAVTQAVCGAVVRASIELGAKAIVTPTETGFTARMVSRHRPACAIAAVTPNLTVRRQLGLAWGVVPLGGAELGSTDDMVQGAIAAVRKAGIAAPGDLVVLSAGGPAGASGSTNLMKIEVVREA